MHIPQLSRATPYPGRLPPPSWAQGVLCAVCAYISLLTTGSPIRRAAVARSCAAHAAAQAQAAGYAGRLRGCRGCFAALSGGCCENSLHRVLARSEALGTNVRVDVRGPRRQPSWGISEGLVHIPARGESGGRWNLNDSGRVSQRRSERWGCQWDCAAAACGSNVEKCRVESWVVILRPQGRACRATVPVKHPRAPVGASCSRPPPNPTEPCGGTKQGKGLAMKMDLRPCIRPVVPHHLLPPTAPAQARTQVTARG